MQQLRLSRGNTLVGRKKCILLYCPEMEDMAKAMMDTSPDLSQHLELGHISWNHFNDGFPNLFIDDISHIRGRSVAFLASLNDPSRLLEQISVLYTLPRYLVKSLIVVLPYFPTGTMERVDQEGQIATANTLARILSGIPLTQKGAAKILIYDLHSLQNRFYFQDNLIPLLVSATHLLTERILKYHTKEEILIAFPDDGAQKRFGKAFTTFEQIICTKVRDGNKRIVTVKEGDPSGKHIFIVDDLVQTGGTLIECKNALLAKGALEVNAFVTHAVFPKESWKNFTEPKDDSKPFTKFYITDSCPTIAKLLTDKSPFHILPLATSIAENISLY